MSAAMDPNDVIAWNRLATAARVVAGTAHDVNNALQIIGGSAELLEGQPGLSDAAKRALARIRSQSARAASLIDDLTRFSRGGGDAAGRMPLKEMVSKAAALRGMMIRRAGLNLTFDAERAPAAEVAVPPGQLLQLVLNLIMDAEQALDHRKGGVITITLEDVSDSAVLNVRDNAPHADGSPRSRGFDVVRGSVPVHEGSPLGLDAARLIARANGGDVTLDQQPDGGCVTLRLPVAGRR
jgi:signal transduction histidine kinase